ncbi:adenylate/guanylate cyclase domain-containing protein [Leifsonia sp. WHRI 6310E]|uniref:adenylate/guanylate cyclase domain-containing protein n=1 Tax=Leifsonia sp. WHRI 6310E TaxID=3162562 RepID=UPI0032EE1B44
MTADTLETAPVPPEATPPGSSAPPASAPPPATPRRRRRGGLSIQSKLLLMLLGVSIFSVLVTGVIGYVNATDSLKEAALKQLTSVRETRAAEIERVFANVRSAVTLGSSNQSAIDASNAFNAAFAQLGTATLPTARTQALDAFYADTFVPALDKRSENTYSADGFTPEGAGAYLQSYYTAPYKLDYDKAITQADAGDGSAWSAANAQYNHYFSDLVTNLNFDDALLLNTQGDVVYSAYKGTDLGTNVLTGPYKNSLLSTAYQKVLTTNTLDATVTTDFERYLPSLGVPTIWVVSPVGQDGKLTGVLAFQINIDTINNVMTGNEGWAKQGLGKTGEVYIAGPDKTMRSASRLLIQDPKAYEEQAIAAGTPPAVAKRIVDVKGTVLLQPVNTTAVNNALKGKTGTSIGASYVGRENLAAYAPLDIQGLNWVIVAREDTSEAFAPAADFTRNLVLSTAALVLVVCLLSLLLAQVFLRPLRRLLDAVKRVAAGEVGVQVDTKSRDEIADLGTAFNDMSRSLQVKADLLEAEQEEHERLLLTLMPEGVAKRYRQGDETIAEDHQDVTVLFADIGGFDDYARGKDSAESLALLNSIVRSFDEAADKYGVERVRTTRQEGYLASCGLTVPRVDNARRMVEFAIAMQGILDRYGAQNGIELKLRAGIDSGTVTSGLVGRTSVVYDMWGDAVNLAHRVQDVSSSPGIYLTQRVVDSLPDSVGYSDSGVLETQGGRVRVWRIDAEAARV